MKQSPFIAVLLLSLSSEWTDLWGQEQAVLSAQEFVRQRFVHGVPYAEARRLGTSAVPILLETLRDTELRASRPNIVQTLGFIGSSSAFEPLVGFLEDTDGEVDASTFRALLLVPRALGDLGRDDPDAENESLRYLTAGTDPGTWNEVRWTFRMYHDDRLHQQLATASVHGLGRLATSAAAEVLSTLRAERGDLAQDADSALELLSEIRSRGPERVLRHDGEESSGSGHDIEPRPTVHDFRISRHASESFDELTADRELLTATMLLTREDPGCVGEVSCAVKMVRQGTVRVFGERDDGLDVIDNKSELDRVFAMKGNIKIVTAINWCGWGADFLGCSKLGAKNSILISTSPADVFVHEFGHNQGLEDARANTCAKYVMHPFALTTDSVTSGECSSLKNR